MVQVFFVLGSLAHLICNTSVLIEGTYLFFALMP